MSKSIKEQQAQMVQLYKRMDDIFHAHAVKLGLSDSAFWIFYALCAAERPYTQNDLCEEWYYPKQTVHSTIASLIKAGYVELTHMPGSRNRKVISLTAAGRAYMNASILPVQDAEERALGRLTEEERNVYLALNEKHIALLNEEIEPLSSPTRPPED